MTLTSWGGGVTPRSVRYFVNAVGSLVRKPYLMARVCSFASLVRSWPMASPFESSGTSVCLESTVGLGYISAIWLEIDPSFAVSRAMYCDS